MRERILITGGAGYIGSVLSQYLLQQGFIVTVLDNLYYKQTSLLSCFPFPHFRFIQGDACNEELIAEEMKKNEIIIPLAALVGAPACESAPLLAKALNLDAIALILKYITPN